MSGTVRRSAKLTAAAAMAIVGALLAGAPGAAYVRPGSTERVSVGPGGVQAKGSSLGAAISADGRYVAFSSGAANLVPGDTNLAVDVFVHDRKKNKTERVSVNSRGEQAIGNSSTIWVTISANGRYVGFESTAINLVPSPQGLPGYVGDTNLQADFFVHDRTTAKTRRVNLSSTGKESFVLSGLNVHSPNISADGRQAVWSSQASDLVPDDENGVMDVFVRELPRGKTMRVSVSSDEVEGNGASGEGGINANGRFVAFESAATNLIELDGNVARDVFVRDLKKGQTERISVASDGSGAPPHAITGGSIQGGPYVITPDGRYVVFQWSKGPAPRAGHLTPAGQTSRCDVFVHDRKTRRTDMVSVTSTGATNPDIFPSCYGEYQAISANGRYVGFAHGELVNGDVGAYIHDRLTGATTMVSRSSSAKADNGRATYIGLTPDARHIMWSSDGTNLVRRDTNDAFDVFVRNIGPALGTGGFDGSGSSRDPSPPDDRICVDPVDICIPPDSALSKHDRAGDEPVMAADTDLLAARIAYRSRFDDLFVAIEVDEMRSWLEGPGRSASPAVVYGLRFTLGGTRYEVRAAAEPTSLLPGMGGRFGLFRCSSNRRPCDAVAELRGGYGTTGHRVVFSVPLRALGSSESYRLRDVTAFSGHGTYDLGTLRSADEVLLSE